NPVFIVTCSFMVHFLAISECREAISFQDQANRRSPEMNRRKVEANRRRLETTSEELKNSFRCRNGSFPCGNESVPHGEIACRPTRLILHGVAGGHFYAETARFHMETTSSHLEMTQSHIGMSPSRLSAAGNQFAPARTDTGTTESRMAAQQSQRQAETDAYGFGHNFS